MQVFFFNKSRVGLRVYLSACCTEKKAVVWAPEYICSVLTDAVESSGFQIEYYSVDDHLQPFESDLQLKPGDILLLIKYFGMKTDVTKFRQLCDLSKSSLVIDNAHGFPQDIFDLLQESAADAILGSPRKILAWPHGGTLWVNNSLVAQRVGAIASELAEIEYPRISSHFINLAKNFFFLKRLIRNQKKISTNYSHPLAMPEIYGAECRLSAYGKRSLTDALLEKGLIQSRRESFMAWHKFVESAPGIRPVFNIIDIDNSPLAFPCWVENLYWRNFWIEWGVRYSFNVFSWPTLPKDNYESDSNATKLWNSIICFPIESGINDYIPSEYYEA